MTESGTGTPPDKTSIRVLIVDDNQDAADTLAMLARMWGHEVQVVYDGEAALAAAVAFQPDCLVLDIGLPRLDGYALARRIREQPGLEKAKLVALSAYSGEQHVRRVKEAGIDHCLVKPADPTVIEELLTMLKQTLKLAERTEALAQQNVALARETKELLTEVKEDIKEVKEEIREVKEEIREVKNNKNA